MEKQWTCSDAGRAIRESGRKIRAERAAQSEPTADDALWTIAKLLTGTGGAIPDAEVRELERWLTMEQSRLCRKPEGLSPSVN